MWNLCKQTSDTIFLYVLGSVLVSPKWEGGFPVPLVHYEHVWYSTCAYFTHAYQALIENQTDLCTKLAI